MGAMTHIEVIDSLLAHVDNSTQVAAPMAVFAATKVGSSFLARGRVPIPDVMAVKCSFTCPVVTIYEVKATRADFLSDIRTDKWRKYLPYCHKFYFATAADVCDRRELQDGVGLMRLSARGHWSTVRGAAVRRPEPDPTDGPLLLALLFAQGMYKRAQRDLADRLAAIDRNHYQHLRHDAARAFAQRLAGHEKECARPQNDVWRLCQQLKGPDDRWGERVLEELKLFSSAGYSPHDVLHWCQCGAWGLVCPPGDGTGILTHWHNGAEGKDVRSGYCAKCRCELPEGAPAIPLVPASEVVAA